MLHKIRYYFYHNLMFSRCLPYITKYCAVNKLIALLALIAVILAFITYYVVAEGLRAGNPDPNQAITLILGNLIIFLTVGVLLTRKFFGNLFDKKTNIDNCKLQNRIIAAFSLVAAVPTIIVSVFSAYFFNFGIQSWFDKKISTVLEQSVIVAESYISEHTLRLQDAALSISDDLNEMYYNLVHNPPLFSEALNAEIEMRSLDEAVVFQTPNTILAQTSLSFSLSFMAIPPDLIEKANQGEIVQIKSDPTKIIMIVRLKERDGIYLLISQLIDSNIINHVDSTNGAAQEYYRLKNRIFEMQITFSIVFIFIALLLLLAAINWGAIFALQIVNPIKKLVAATEKAKNGDLTVQVPELDLNDDEIAILSVAFNRMIKQINCQQKDLVVAQRALAWSDVARRVAHEIKNPLTPIRLSAERLLKKFAGQVEDQAAFNKYLHTIIRHADDITNIVVEFVNFAKLPAPNFVNCELTLLINDMVESRKLLHDKISYSVTADPLQINFIGDITQINQVMINILKNAEESPGHSNLKLKIAVSITKVNELVTIIIADNGPGFPLSTISRATEAYVTTKIKGTGLGLAIVKKIVQEHFGTLQITNRPAGGAVITIIFNLDELRLKLK